MKKFCLGLIIISFIVLVTSCMQPVSRTDLLDLEPTHVGNLQMERNR